jgi:hypothetical protein
MRCGEWRAKADSRSQVNSAEPSLFSGSLPLKSARWVPNPTVEREGNLTKELANITGNDRYPFSVRIRALAILGKL